MLNGLGAVEDSSAEDAHLREFEHLRVDHTYPDLTNREDDDDAHRQDSLV
jgi:hypothetical protein